MGVGLSMAAMLFPVGIMENEASVNCSVGTNVCTNGLDVAKLVLKHSVLNGTAFQPRTTLLSIADSASPVPATPDPATIPGGIEDDYWIEDLANPGDFYPKALKGFLVFAGQVAAGQNNYQLVVVSYAKNEPTNVIQADRAIDTPTAGAGAPLDIQTNSVDEYVIQNPASDFPAEYLQPDRMVVFLNGQFAKIAGTNADGNYYFDRPVPTDSQAAWFIVEKDGPDPATSIVLTDSPCMSALASRTAVSN